MHPLGFVVSLLLQRTACCGANVFVAAHRLDPTQDLKFSATENNPVPVNENTDGGNHCSLPNRRLVKKPYWVKEKKIVGCTSGAGLA